MQELRAKERKPLLHKLVVTEPYKRIGQLVQCENFSSVARLLRVTAYVLCAVEKFKKKLRETLLSKAEILLDEGSSNPAHEVHSVQRMEKAAESLHRS